MKNYVHEINKRLFWLPGKPIILLRYLLFLRGLFILIIKNALIFILIYILLVQTTVQTLFSVSSLPSDIHVIAEAGSVQSTVQVFERKKGLIFSCFLLLAPAFFFSNNLRWHGFLDRLYFLLLSPWFLRFSSLAPLRLHLWRMDVPWQQVCSCRLISGCLSGRAARRIHKKR